LVTGLIPDRTVRYAVELSYGAAHKLAPPRSIARQASIRRLEDLRERSLDECDGLTQQVMVSARALATMEGLATGAGGPWTTLIDVPLLFASALRTIIRIGQCYGYPTDGPEDRYFILGILTIATAGSLATRIERLEQLQDLEKLLIEEIQVDMIRSELLSFLFQLEVFEEIPGVGIISGSVLNISFMNKVAVASRRVFQERWLRDNGKINAIAAAPASARDAVPGWAGLAVRAAYSLSYHVTFGAALPALAMASLARGSFTMAKAGALLGDRGDRSAR
jgi:EcsC protein family